MTVGPKVMFGHEVAVHDVEVEAVRAGLQRPPGLAAQVRQVAVQDAGADAAAR